MQARGLVAAAIVSLAGAGFSAQALGPQAAQPATAPAVVGYEADDHFPGAAYYTAIEDSEVAATGEAPELDLSVVPAQPFAATGSASDRARALQCLTTAIYYEAGTEPEDGKRAVAQVVLNRVRHPAFPATVCGVVFQGSERPGCQFSFACDGAMARRPMQEYWQEAQAIAREALDGSVFAPAGLATFYHTYAVTPKWNRRMVMTGTFGAHFFHRWKGADGTAQAFTQVYRGHEPLPAPHPGIAPVAAPVAAPIAIAPAATAPDPRPAAPRDQVRAAYSDSGNARAAYPAPLATNDDSQILDKWKDSGKPLR